MTLTWKSSWTDSELRIFRGKVIAGLLKTNLWKSEAHGELDGYLLRFKDKGFFNMHTEIQDINGNTNYGRIEYSGWGNSATITYEGATYEWKFESWKRRSWYVKNEEDQAVFKLTNVWDRKGEVENEGIPPTVILAAFYVRTHFKKMATAIGAGTN